VKPPCRDRRTVAHVVISDDKESGYCCARSIATAKPQGMSAPPSCGRDFLLTGHKRRVTEQLKVVGVELDELVGGRKQLTDGLPFTPFGRMMRLCQEGSCFIRVRCLIS
jgi:hypothetical protein